MRTSLSPNESKFIILRENKIGTCLPCIRRTSFPAFSSWNSDANIFVHDNYKPEQLCHWLFLCCGFCMLWTRVLNVCSLEQQQQLDLLQQNIISCPGSNIRTAPPPKDFWGLSVMSLCLFVDRWYWRHLYLSLTCIDTYQVQPIGVRSDSLLWKWTTSFIMLSRA